MSKRETGWTENKIAKYQKEKRGQGELNNYKPWLTTQDVPSEGRNHRFMGWKTNREHQFFSDLEFKYLCLVDWADDVIDIREQYPLDRMVTMKIAEDLGFKHPSDPKTGTPIVMTTDFLLTVRIDNRLVYKARTIKPSNKLNEENIIKKFELERIYWERKGVDWGIVTEKEMPSPIVDNLKFLRNSYLLDGKLNIKEFLAEWVYFRGELLQNLKYFDEKYNYEPGTGILIYRHLLARKALLVDMNKVIDLRENAENIQISQKFMQSEERLA